ncbi:GATA zinc finger domain-containing protein 10-like [Cimex lectularius]|uniref:Protein naked cuticle homolog n=1 Tax=Cimex lectularius TaxID=79782 RepID=A0A8I6R991_CIMLE|nr:GATA zinc finger domain-containing protein 10-like [Cimex lectularius]
MANYLVRWWKTKFLSGYKQFTGADDDVEDARSENPASTNLKELSCDMPLKEGTTPVGKDRLQEFSFTLYDFDGHGKVTKDDIAGLVTTIYETLGSSLKVPHYGSKTIKVKLTVTPNIDIAEKNKAQTVLHNCNNNNNTINNNHFNNNFNNINNNNNNNDNHNHSINNSKGFKKDFNVTIRERRTGKVGDADITHHTMSHVTPTMNCNGCRSKKRSSSLQRQQLLKIIQANMEKNNLPFQTSRASPLWAHEKEKIPRSHPWRGGQESLGRHHHQKHRHREAEQARAMAQVVKWLEQEFSSPKQDHNKYSPTNDYLEHRHIHEHVHHHYHHYQDTPISI